MSAAGIAKALSGEGVATRLALLCLQRDGRIATSHWADQAVRAGILVDLALHGRLVDEPDHVAVVAAAEDDPPHAALVHQILAHPERSLAEVIEDADVGLVEMTAWLVDRGRWVARPTRLPWRHDRYRPADPSLSRATLMPFVSALAPGGELTTPAWAATAVIARVAGLLDGRFGYADDELVDVCGPVAWVVRTGAEQIFRARVWYRVVT
ncbi:GPP34 family phosphoprotein [Geodermatophilus marinus]|uniref:GPP34 family phosphoprotein n=1 Tax=Geodermatophilus sp. LHW52908 TaxID=2303986 RepID=UPI0011C127F7|nr:GPP34 family phosphoprotein [Geodermatophilus sp. LHW52908]